MSGNDVDLDSNRLIRYDKERTSAALNRIHQEVKLHVGEFALLYREEKKVMIPRLVEVESMYTHFVLVRYKTYDSLGIFRQYLYTAVAYSELYCSDSIMTYFLEEI